MNRFGKEKKHMVKTIPDSLLAVLGFSFKTRPQASLGLVLKEKPTAPAVGFVVARPRIELGTSGL